jgi:hypothetical protein
MTPDSLAPGPGGSKENPSGGLATTPTHFSRPIRIVEDHIVASSSKNKPRTGAAKAALVAWMLSGAALLVALLLWTGPAALAYGELDLTIPGLAMWVLSWGTWLEAPLHLATAFLVLVATALPYGAGMRGKFGTRFYTTLGMVAVLALGASWMTLKRPIDNLANKLHATPR